jgi:hypothetical protein
MPVQLPPACCRKRSDVCLPTMPLLKAAGMIVCFSCMISCAGNANPVPAVNPDATYVNGLSTHSLDQRKKDLADLLAEAEHEQTLNKKDVESRMGRADKIDQTGSKEFEDRVISTCYHYDLAAGEYTLPDLQPVTIGSGGRAEFVFSERVTYGSRGRPWSIRDDSAPLSFVTLVDESGIHLMYPTRIRQLYPADLHRPPKANEAQPGKG